jgi:GntR family transcriptional regulator
MNAEIVIDLGAAIPVYEQIRSQLAGAIDSGRVPSGVRLPSVRALAADLGIAVNTVVRAYAELESAGLIVNRRGSGATVAAVPDAEAGVAAAAASLASLATAASMTTDRVIDLVRSAMLTARSTAAAEHR